MKPIKGLSVGDRVHDSWWPWRRGRVTRVGKTRVRVQYGDDVWTYDRAHLKFLRKT